MRQSDIEGKQWIFDILKNGGVRSVITGEIYKDFRPSGSIKEDIVINSITINNTFFQTGAFNVNCYVPYLKVTINSVTQNVPNEARLKAVKDAVKPLLENKFTNNGNIDIEFSSTIMDEKDCYINFRLKLNAFNNK
ncbi:hypothetical protein U9K52_09735 [Chryseobacterium sp. MHB01]|uniref:hypothetical protein n=1 Tax=Chryseobacterium sp. MHB01 TaxID=3109433 RepID=UPI002AFF8458|nr:hypothetical protein [Chryseobacterium sp. MHB01]MEA1849192.1 hypothetical protein [Chryseobacterium sp. MHB01]